MAPVDPAEKSQQRSTMLDSRKQQKMAKSSATRSSFD